MEQATQIPIWKDRSLPWEIREKAAKDAGLDPALDDELMDEIVAMIKEVRKEIFEENWKFDPVKNYWKFVAEDMDGFVKNDSIIIPVETGGFIVTTISQEEEEKAAAAKLSEPQVALNLATA
ncbi:MAG: hypothetical protein FWG64_08120 [Firmicutes bacterium]|nr:hypothetical protein [Bacillota bacterium]